MSRKPKKHKSSRKDFKLDVLLPRIKAQTHEASLVTTAYKFLTIKYLGFFSKEGKPSFVYAMDFCKVYDLEY